MTDPIIIVGAGVSGLRAASLLHSQGIECVVYEARDRIGGRVLSKETVNRPDLGRFDLGPTWFWPQSEPVIEKLVHELGLKVFEHYSEGAILFEQSEEAPVQRHHLPKGAVEPSYRIAGGIRSLVEALAATLPPDAIQTSTQVTEIMKEESGKLTVTMALPDGRKNRKRAEMVIVAVPPRLAAARITFKPDLSKVLKTSLHSQPTWMAGHAKAIAVYEQPFWRLDGLSGQAMSRVGPLQEIHDASPETGPGALFGFLGLSPKIRHELGEKRILELAVEQLIRIYGPKAENPTALLYKDWSNDPDTAVADDLLPLREFPAYGPQGSSEGWGTSISFVSTETSSDSGGHLEGALRSAERSVADILKNKHPHDKVTYRK